MVPDRGATETNNVVFFDGKIVVRPGMQIQTDLTPSPLTNGVITHLGTMVTQDQIFFLMRVEAQGTVGRVFVYDPTMLMWTEITPASLFVAADAHRPTSCQFKGEWLLATGGSNLMRWTGTGNLVDVTAAQSDAALKAPLNPYFVCASATRVFVANAEDPATNERIPWRVWWSDSLNSGIWSNGAGLGSQGSAGYQDLTHDSSPITAMVFHGSTNIVVLKRHSIYRSVFRGSPVWYDFLPVTRSRGCVASGSVQAWNEELIWLGDDFNVYAMGLDGRIQAIGDSIRPRIESLFNVYYSWAVSSMVDIVHSLYWLMIPYDQVGGVANKIFVCNLKTGAWSESAMETSTLQMASALWYWPDPPFYIRHPQQLWGGSDGNIYVADYANPVMADGDAKFEATWWGRVVDFLAELGGKGETMEYHKAALHGLTGVAFPQIRMGKNLKALVNAQPQQLNPLDAQDMDGDPVAYSANKRVDPERFGQFGIRWPRGISNPAQVGGFTAWGQPRGEAR